MKTCAFITLGCKVNQYETQETHFTNTLEVCRKAGFSRMHVFSFSPRKGTPAAEMPDQCPPQTIKQGLGDFVGWNKNAEIPPVFAFNGIVWTADKIYCT